MSVSQTVTLPNTPTDGDLRLTPLGGNGYTDPFAQYDLKNFLVTGDAGGGTASLEVLMDPRFCCMLAYASMTYGGASSDPQTVRWVWGGGVGGVSPVFLQTRRIALADSSVGAIVNDSFDTPAIVHGSDPSLALTLFVINDLADVLQLHASFFLFNINARQKVPYARLAAARGGI